nr:hypothetical protein [Tanacetum cinerariifolium]
MEAKSSRQVTFSKRRVGEDLIDDWYGNDVVETGQPTNEFNECYGHVLAVDNSSNSEQESNIGQLEEMKKDAVDELKMNSNILEKFGSEEMKKNLVMEDDNDSIMINNSQPMFDSDLSLDMSWSDSDMFDMSWINTYFEHGVNPNFHHGVEVLNRNIPAKMGSEEMKKNLVVFGGRSMGDWEKGMKNPEDGYKSFKI